MKVGWNSEILNSICEVEYGTRVVRKRDAGTIFPVYGGGGATFFMDTFNRENRLVIGRFAISEKCTRFVSGKFFLNDSGLTVSPKIRNLTQQYIDWYMLYKNDEIYSLGKGSAQRNLDVDEFRKLTIFFPESLPEQERIVKILDAAFEKIDRLKENAEKGLQAVKDLWQATLREELKPKEGWGKYKLSEVSVISRGKSKHRPRNDKRLFGGRYPFVQTGDIRDSINWELKSYTQTYSEFGLQQSKIWPKGTLCITIAANIGETAILQFDACFPDSVVGIVVDKQKAETKFINYFFVNSKEELNDIAYGTAQKNINNVILENMDICLPSLNEQQKIIKKLDKLSTVCQDIRVNYEQEIAEYEALKQSILRKAFSGEL